MIKFYFREPSGKLLMSGICGDDELEYQSFGNAILEVGEADIHKQYFSKNGLTDYPEKPGQHYYFDFDSESWVFDEPSGIADAIAKRDQLLADGPDRINPLWWASMTPAQQSAWESYRQALLDITDQPGFPMAIDWPSRPDAQKIE